MTAPQITIADRCATPLASCQSFALAQQFTIETWQVNLLQLDSANRFDAVIVHGLLPFFDADEQKLLIANLSQCLRPGGYFINLGRYHEQKHADADEPRNVSDRAMGIFNALIEGGVDLPDSEQSFRQKLQDYASGNRQRISNLKRPDELAPLLEEAGLQVSENLKAFIYASGRPRGYDWTTCYFAIIAEKNS